MQPVVKPVVQSVWQQVVSCKRGFKTRQCTAFKATFASLPAVSWYVTRCSGNAMSSGRLVKTAATDRDWHVCWRTCITWRLPRDHQRAPARNQESAGVEPDDWRHVQPATSHWRHRTLQWTRDVDCATFEHSQLRTHLPATDNDHGRKETHGRYTVRPAACYHLPCTWSGSFPCFLLSLVNPSILPQRFSSITSTGRKLRGTG